MTKMNQLINDWIDFKTSQEPRPHGYFTTLFTEVSSLSDLQRIYGGLPNEEALIDCAVCYLFGWNKSASRPSKSNLEYLLRKDFEQRNNYHGDLYKGVSLQRFDYIEDSSEVEGLMWGDTWTEGFYDFMRKLKVSDTEVIYELFSALYYIPSDFDCQLYMFAPLLKTEYTARSVALFKALGGLYAVTESGVKFSWDEEIFNHYKSRFQFIE